MKKTKDNVQEEKNTDNTEITENVETNENAAQNNDANTETQAEEDELSLLKKELHEMKDKHLRLFAEFENYKKRTLKEKIDLLNSAAEDTLSVLLPVLDDFDRAKKSAEQENSKEVFSEGVSLVYQKLYATLHQKGLKAMESTGLAFDPELHEAITEIPAPTEDMKGKVIDTIEKGYYLKEKIIRYAKVVVGK